MKRWRARLLLAAGAAAVAAVAVPASGQRDRAPESLLPPGFGDPVPPPPPAPPPPPEPGGNDQSPSTPAPPPAPPTLDELLPVQDTAAEDLEELADEALPPAIEMPEASRRPVDRVGALTPDNWGFGPGAFGAAHGRFLTTLMGRLDVPLPSRWTSMLLRRVLLSRLPSPPQVNPVDWVAERAWLLVRMGEADAARALVQAVDVDRITPRLFTVAVQVALATGDPAALCPLVPRGREVSDEPVWPLADAMCASLAGESARASQLIDQARSRGTAGGIDLLLAEKVVGAGANTRRAVQIEWQGVDQLTSWRFGLAAATGAEIPPELLAGAGPHVRAWHARAPMVPLDRRVDSAEAAASLGVFSNAALVELHSLLADSADPAEVDGTIGGRLRHAYTARTIAARLDAMAGLWSDADTPDERHARRILTAAAAAGVPPADEHARHAGDLIASMLSAGLDRAAARWSGVVEGMGEEGDRAWSLLAVAAPRPAVDVGAGRVEAYLGRDDSPGGHRGRMLVAALAGLGRLSDPAALGVPIRESRWSRMLDSAARAGQPGTVALLAAVGMQTESWRGVPPHHLYHALVALRRVGLEYEARMIAAEAISRL